MTSRRPQLVTLLIFVLVNALLVVATYLFIPFEQLFPPGTVMPPQVAATPRPIIALIYGIIVLVLYGLLGLAGFGLARLLGLAPMFREKAGWRAWFWQPLVVGLVLGVILVALDRLFAFAGGSQGFSHPQFPFSIMASATAGIGEEIMFRLFVLGLWAWLANLVLARWQATSAALWIGNVVAALAFAAAHLPAAMGLAGVADPLQLPPLVLLELFLLNGLIGLVCGQRSWKNGLVAAIGIHFWADIIWHVVWPLIALR